MKIKYEDIDRIINILQESKNKLKPGEVFEFNNNKLEINNFKLPEKWYVERNENNYRTINSYANSIFPSKGWEGKSRYLANKIHYPISKHNIPSGYIEITYQDFITNIYQRNLPF